MDAELNRSIQQAARLISGAKSTVAFTGAGISTASGIPDFRSPDSGLWEKYDPYTVASLTAFRTDPEIFFDWIKPLYLQSHQSKPNSAHLALAELERQGKMKCIVTQNIDGLHQKAGSKEVIELHGSARTATCSACNLVYDGDKLLSIYAKTDQLPACPFCGKIIKPDVVLFEEPLPQLAWQRASQLMHTAEAVLVVGSSLETYPANTLPQIAVENGASLIINTISSTPLDHKADVLIQADVAQVIPAIARHVLN